MVGRDRKNNVVRFPLLKNIDDEGSKKDSKDDYKDDSEVDGANKEDMDIDMIYLYSKRNLMPM